MTASSIRSFLTAGTALASVAAMCCTATAVVAGQPAGLWSPPAFSQAPYELTAASDIVGPGLGVALIAGWGRYIGPDDPYFPGEFNNNVKITGLLGVAYYVIDTSMDGTNSKNLENYIFEVGARSSDPIGAGLKAAAYVAVASNLGVDSVFAKLAKSAIYGVPFDVNAAIVALTAPIALVGDITSVYFTGQIPGDPTLYGTGFDGLLAYTGTRLPWLQPLLGPAGTPAVQLSPAAVTEPPASQDAVVAAPDVQIESPAVEDAPAKAASAESADATAAEAVDEAVQAEAVQTEAAEPTAGESSEPVGESAPEAAPRRSAERGQILRSPAKATQSGHEGRRGKPSA